jgi:hypothetical protein
MKNRVVAVLIALIVLIGLPAGMFAQGTAFTYQGRLNSSGTAATGLYDFRFRLAADSLGNTYVGSAYLTNGVGVTNGLFITAMDFGAGVFTSSNYWLEVDVRTNGAGGYTALTPLQAITPVPYAIFANTASNLTGVVAAAQIAGTMTLAQLPATLVTNNGSISGTFAGNGAGVTNVNAAALNGLNSGNFWQLGGNNVSAGQFLGSTNYQPVEIWSGGNRVAHFEAVSNDMNHSGIANVINGSSANYAFTGMRGVTVAGGGAANLNGLNSANYVTGDFGAIGGGFLNNCAAQSVVAGGCANVASGQAATIGGGTNNGSYAYAATVAGGAGNAVGVSASYSAIAGGLGNTISYGNTVFIGGGQQNYSAQDCSVIGGGVFNTNQSFFSCIVGGSWNYNSGGRFSMIGCGNGNQNLGSWWSVIGGGLYNTNNNVNYGFVGGGLNNNNAGYGSSIVGGSQNSSSGIFSAVGGGELNNGANTDATVAGGQGNSALASFAAVGGGQYNSATNSGATVPGGHANIAGGLYSFAAGNGAFALHAGTFVWADSGVGAFASTGTNQFLIRAQGGMGVNTNNPNGAALNVNGTVVATGFAGNGAGLNNLNAANFTGTVADANLSTNVALLNANQTFAGINNLTNAANVISGNGANLTGIPRNYFTGGYIGVISPTGGTNVFIGPTIPPLSLTAGQTVMLSTSAALGTSAASLQFNYCPSYTLNGGPVTFLAGGNYLTPIATAAGGRQIYSQSLTMTIPTAGTYVFGCGVGNTSTTNLNNNDYVNVSVLIFK